MAIQSLPVRFAIDRAGLVGADGPTHAGAFDIDLSRLPARLRGDGRRRRGRTRPHGRDRRGDRRPARRLPLSARRRRRRRHCPSAACRWRSAGAAIVREGSKVAILSLRHAPGRVPARRPRSSTPTGLSDDRRRRALRQAARHRPDRPAGARPRSADHGRGRRGRRLRRARAAHLAAAGALDRGLKVRTLALPDRFVDQDKPEAMYAAAGLDAAGIVGGGLRGAGPQRRLDPSAAPDASHRAALAVAPMISLRTVRLPSPPWFACCSSATPRTRRRRPSRCS